ncbi:ribokinase, partial [Lecanoromycetidae sp. Uapishka_2]
MGCPSIFVIGSLNVDLITRTTRVPAAGETIISKSFDTGSGGKGANQAVACARLSRRNREDSVDMADVLVRMIGAVGDDPFGQNLVAEIPLDTTLRILDTAKKQAIPVLLNPAPAQVLPKEAYAAVTHLIVNESEAAIITNSSEKNLRWSEWGDHIERIVSLGVYHVIITLGAQGVVYLDTVRERQQIFAAHDVEVVDTTAAGDTFVGAYAVGVARARSPRSFADMVDVVDWANEAAAKTVQKSGAQSAIPWLEEVPRHLGTRHGHRGMSFAQWRMQADNWEV